MILTTNQDFLKNKFKEKLKRTGLYKIKKYKNNILIRETIIKNILTNNALDELAQAYNAVNPDIEINHLAIGTDNTAPTANDTTLGTEVYRLDKTDINKTDTGEYTSEFVLYGSSYAGAIEEIGIFAGTTSQSWGGGAGADTGLMVSRVLYSDTIAVDESIYFQRIDGVEG